MQFLAWIAVDDKFTLFFFLSFDSISQTNKIIYGTLISYLIQFGIRFQLINCFLNSNCIVLKK